MHEELNWTDKPFDKLLAAELYAILQLRNQVFVVEQQCVFQDADDKDPLCIHLMGWKENVLQAYARILPPGISYVESSIGRIVTSPASRGQGIGRILMEHSLALVNRHFGQSSIRISAQIYLKKFYESFAFRQSGAVYIEDNIEHIEMTRIPSSG
jgi:ElaA protein